MNIVRRAILLAILIDILLIAFAALNIDSPLSISGGALYVVKAAVPLLVYGFAFFSAQAIRGSHYRTSLLIGTGGGIVGGLLQVIHMALENFGSHIGDRPKVTIGFMLGGFLVWAAAGFSATRETGFLNAGILASLVSAMVSALIAITFGLILMTVNLPPPSYVETWPEFQHSGWGNAHAFAIANSLDAVFSHFIIAPIIGILLGVIATSIAKLAFCTQKNSPHH